MKKLILLLIVLFISSCSNNEVLNVELDVDILGVWVNPEYSESTIKFERADKLLENGYGISFEEKNVFVERNSGWCGTPPLSFSNYTGSWSKNDSILKINIDNGFSSLQNYTWKIKSLTNKLLIIEKIK